MALGTKQAAILIAQVRGAVTGGLVRVGPTGINSLVFFTQTLVQLGSSCLIMPNDKKFYLIEKSKIVTIILI